MPRTNEITTMQRQFVKGIAEGMNQTQAALQAGYAHPKVAGSRLMSSPSVKAVIADVLEEHGLDDNFIANCVRELCLASKPGKNGGSVPDWIGRSRGLDILCKIRGTYAAQQTDINVFSFEQALTEFDLEDENTVITIT